MDVISLTATQNTTKKQKNSLATAASRSFPAGGEDVLVIVDSQVHIWGADTPERPWPGRGVPNRPTPLGKEELLQEMNAAGVDRAIIVPPFWEGDRNDLAIAAAQSHPDRFAVMGRVNPDLPGARGALASWRSQPGMLGLRLSFHSAELRPLLTEGRANWIWEEAEKSGIPIYIFVRPADLPYVDNIALKHPGLRITLDHMCLPSGKKDDEAFADFDKALALSRRPNVAAKVSAFPNYTADSYPFRKLHPYIRQAYDAYGPRRIFWGSDVSRLESTYRQCISLFTEELPWLDEEDLEWVMGRGVCEWLGWSTSAAPCSGANELTTPSQSSTLDHS